MRPAPGRGSGQRTERNSEALTLVLVSNQLCNFQKSSPFLWSFIFSSMK